MEESKREAIDVLEHHGILGMKWGVRRYQNKDGSYTRAGMERYRKAEKLYKESDDRYKSAKNDYDNNMTDRATVKEAARERSEQKKRLSTAYDQLKNDYKADKGKELYRKGRTITDANKVVSAIGATGSTMLMGSIYLNRCGALDKKTSAITGSSGAVLMGASLVANILKMHGDSQLRSYYAHESQKNLDKKVFKNK